MILERNIDRKRGRDRQVKTKEKRKVFWKDMILERKTEIERKSDRETDRKKE